MRKFTKAERLDDIYRTMDPQPLVDKQALDAFYRPEINSLRGSDKIRHMELGLRRAHAGLAFKAFFMGHSGVGKSTELTRLVDLVRDKYTTLRFSVMNELDPVSFQPFDVLLLMMIRLVEQTAKPTNEGGADKRVSDQLLQNLLDWFAEEKETVKKNTAIGASVEAGAGLKGDGLWAKALGLFANLKGEIKYAVTRQKEVVNYRLSRLSDLIKLVNSILEECNRALAKKTGREWLVIIEDFDKAGIPTNRTEDLFITYGNVIQALQAHVIFIIPIALGYGPKATHLPIPSNNRHVLPDTPVFNPNHSHHEAGRRALRTVLEARVSSELFAEGQMERLIEASGGNLRGLFSLVNTAADHTLLKEPVPAQIQADEVTIAINQMRTEYERMLGENPYDPQPIPYSDKADRLVRIYNQDPEADVPDPVLYALLRSRAVQEFNGKQWFGVHPLVVDILVDHGRLDKPEKGPVRGGTR